MPKWLKYDSDDDVVESEYSKRTHNRNLRKPSRLPEEESPRRQSRKRQASHTGEYEQSWIPAAPSRQRKTVPAR